MSEGLNLCRSTIEPSQGSGFGSFTLRGEVQEMESEI
jgi:hypothetical protein